MSSKVLISLTVNQNAADMAVLNTNSPQDAAIQIENLMAALASGATYGKMDVYYGALALASGTVTFDTVIATDAFAVDGITFTCVANGATGNQFNLGADDTESAANATTVINANTTLNKYLVATSAAEVITITTLVPGAVGNTYTLTTADATITVSGATLTGGSNGTDVSYSLGMAL